MKKVIQRASAAGVLTLLAAVSVYAAELFSINIAAQSTQKALLQLAKTTDAQIIFSPELTEGLNSPAVKGDLTLEQALSELLSGTSLAYSIGSDGIVAIENNKSAAVEKAPYINEIIVTAEKREQNVQDVPVAISAFTAKGLEARGIATPQDLQFSVPGLVIGEQNNTGGTAKATIRGVGTENYQPGGDPGVPMHINGHYTQSTAYVFRDMIDVERVEVQRGPQGTLYGRNAMGGNINIITKRPTMEFEGLIGLDVGNYSKRQVQAVVGGPLNDNFRGRLVFADAERDGFVEDVGSVGDDRNTTDYTSIRGALEIDITNDIQLYLNTYYFDDTGNTYARRLDNNSANIANTEPFKVRTNTPSENSDESRGVSVDISWSLENMEFRSLTAYDDTFKTAIVDLDNSDTRLFEFGVELGFETMTQEFQLLSIDEGPVKWVTGLFYYKEKSDLFFDIPIDFFDTNENGLTIFDGDFADPRVLSQTSAKINADSLAAYGQLDYTITDKIVLVMGLRYTKDEKDRFQTRDRTLEGGGTSSVLGGIPSSAVIRDNRDGDNWNETTGKLGINYHVNADLMLYASYSRGYKAGGYNTDQDETYNPEYVDALEVGMKSQWLDNRVQANLAAFYYKYSDKQDFQRFINPETNAASDVIFKIINASEVTSYGAEFELQAYIIDQFFIDGSVAYLNAEFDNFDSLDTNFSALGVQDLSGNKVPFSPKWKFNVGVQYDWSLDNTLGSIFIRGDYVWVDDQWSNAFNRDGIFFPGDGDLIPSYQISQARLQWKSIDEKWSVELYIRNITDEVAVSNSFVESTATNNVVNLDPRTYGLKLFYRF